MKHRAHDGSTYRATTVCYERDEAEKVARRSAMRHMLAMTGETDIRDHPGVGFPIETLIAQHAEAYKPERDTRLTIASRFAEHAHIASTADLDKMDLPIKLAQWMAADNAGDDERAIIRGLLDEAFNRGIIGTELMPRLRRVLADPKPVQRDPKPDRSKRAESTSPPAAAPDVLALAERIMELRQDQREAIERLVVVMNSGSKGAGRKKRGETIDRRETPINVKPSPQNPAGAALKPTPNANASDNNLRGEQ